MKVVCLKVLSPGGVEVESSPWLTVGREYKVISLRAHRNGEVWLHIITDDPQSLGWFESVCFRVSEGSAPSSWTTRIHPDGTLDMGPAPWMTAGFWEAYYDAEPEAVETVDRELAAMA